MATPFKDWLNGLTSKTTPVDTDELYVRDSSGTPSSKKLTWANIKATLKSYFDTVYVPGGSSGQVQFNNGGSFGGDSGLTFNNSTKLLTVGGNITMQAASDYSSVEVRSSANYGSFVFGTQRSSFLCGDGFASTNGHPLGATWGGYLYIAADSSSPGEGTGTIHLLRDESFTLAQRNGTNAQTSRLYGTYTDASNYRRVALAMTTAGVASIAPEGAGTGASGNVLHISGLPTSNPGPGILWNDAGTVKVGT